MDLNDAKHEQCEYFSEIQKNICCSLDAEAAFRWNVSMKYVFVLVLEFDKILWPEFFQRKISIVRIDFPENRLRYEYVTHT